MYSLFKKKALIHDSYTCQKFGGTPFPTQRIGDCYVGRVGDCNSTGHFMSCPVECRPEQHLDWKTC